MPIFSNKSEDERRQRQQTLDEDVHRDESLSEALNELVARGEKRSVTEALTEAEEAVDKGTKLDIYGIKVMEYGRCPECHGRTENFLYTTICAACGWYRRKVPDRGRCIVRLNDGETIECDHVFRVSDNQFLCVTDGVVRSQVMVHAVRRVEYVWEDEELQEAREQVKRLIKGACSWCEKGLEQVESDGPFVDYVAFGRLQERYVFCATKCMRQFRRQFPTRIHRNCYEDDCSKCDKCIKRYDTTGFKRTILH